MNFQSVSTAQKLPTSRTEGDLSGSATGGYLMGGTIPGPVLSNALDFVDQSLGLLVSTLDGRGLIDDTAIIVSAKHGQSPMDISQLNRIKDGKIIDALNAAWNTDFPLAANPLVAQGTDDDAMLLWLNDRSDTATSYAKNFLSNYSDLSASVDGIAFTSAGLTEIHAGADAAAFIGVDPSDPRVPDVIGIAQYGVVFTGHKAKIAEHGGNGFEDRNVPILLVRPETRSGTVVTTPATTAQIAPTILKLLGLNPSELQAVALENTQPLF